MNKPEYDKKIIPDAPESMISELQAVNEHLMFHFAKIQEDDKQRKHSLQSAANTISRILNELRSIELSGEAKAD